MQIWRSAKDPKKTNSTINKALGKQLNQVQQNVSLALSWWKVMTKTRRSWSDISSKSSMGYWNFLWFVAAVHDVSRIASWADQISEYKHSAEWTLWWVILPTHILSRSGPSVSCDKHCKYFPHKHREGKAHAPLWTEENHFERTVQFSFVTS